MPMPSRPTTRARLAGFLRDEDGSMIIFSMFVMIMMLIVGGMAVDFMRFETKRTQLQSTLDRAVLAAADLDQAGDPETVVRDYFEKAGLLEEITSIEVVETINSRLVRATAELEMQTTFLDLVGVEELDVPARGGAMESVSDIEVILVLDVSGSMGDPSDGSTKIALLRTAAREFVATVLQNDTERRISVGIVPFNAQVNLGPTMFNAMVANGYNITNRHGIANSFCLDLPASAYTTPGLARTLAIPQAGWFDGVSSTTASNNFTAPLTPSSNQFFCRLELQNMLRLPGQNISTLQSQIGALTANGNTSITMGMEWGLFMLDPGTRGLFHQLVAAGSMPAPLAGRPFDWDREDTLKVIVVMTDGEHVPSQFLRPGFRTEISPIFRHTDGRYSIRHSSGHPAGTPFWVPHLSQWHWRAWNGTTPGNLPRECNPSDNRYNEANCVRVASGMTALSWHQVWQQVRVSWVARELYARALGSTTSQRNSIYNSMMDSFTDETTVSNMNATLQQSCAQARDNGVVVFGIAFEAPANGQTQIYNCASSPSHYYDATGLQIRSVFRAIAAQINSLRLIQ